MQTPSPSFPSGGGKAGAALRAFAWDGSRLGAPEGWPAALGTLVGILLGSEQPMLVVWGPDLVALHNDAQGALMGEPRPGGPGGAAADAPGRPLFEVWPDAREPMGPLLRRAMAGEALRLDDIVVPVARAGRAAEAHFSLSLTPVRDGGAVAGVLCLMSDTTAAALAERRKTVLIDLADRIRLAEGPRAMVAGAVEVLGRHLKANRVGYGEVQADGATILLETSFVDGVAPLHGLFPLDRFGAGNVARHEQGLTVHHDDIALAQGEDQAAWSARQTRSFAGVPLIRDNRFRASLYVSFRQPHAWSADEIALIEEVAGRIWDALERARAEEALRVSEGRFRAAVAAVQGIVWTNNAAGEMVDGQDGWSGLTGQTHDQYRGYGWADAVHPDDAAPTTEAWRAAVAERRPFVFEHRVRRHDGAWRTFSIRAIPVLDEAGTIREWVGVHSDVTDQKAAERGIREVNAELVERIAEERALNLRLAAQGAALARARESLEAIFNASSEGLTFCRLVRGPGGQAVDYQVLDVNPAHRLLTGATREQMLATTVSRVNPPFDPRWIESAEAAVRTGSPQTFEVRSRDTGKWLDIHVSPVSGDLFAQTFIDVTARHAAEEQRARLISEMNHRVMNNFQMVAGVLDLQSRRSRNPEVREQLETAVRRVHLLAELHERLAFAPDLGTIDVRAYLSAVCARLRGLISDPARIQLTLDAEPATLDAALAIPLGFVVNELVTNAIKYAFPPPDAGEVGVSFHREGTGFLLRVADGGAGLPPNVEAKGTGLGMRLVGQFVRQIDGTLEVSHTPGVRYSIRFGGPRA